MNDDFLYRDVPALGRRVFRLGLATNFGVEGVDLYGGTKHSTAMAFRKVATPEEIKRAMMESTNKAFERYFRIEADEVRSVYERTKQIVHPEQHLNNITSDSKSSKVLKFK